jgi:hypothetical protein
VGVAETVSAYLDAVDAEAPGLVEGLYLVGSAALDDFRPGDSDLDYLAVTAERPGPAAVAALALAHRRLREARPRPLLRRRLRHLGRPGARPGDRPARAGQPRGPVRSRDRLPRRAAELVVEALADTRVVVISGARQVGKSTLAEVVAHETPGAVTRFLDNPLTRAAALEDPVRFVRHDGLLLIDEVQRVPELWLAIKDVVDRDPQPGRFLLTVRHACWRCAAFQTRCPVVPRRSSCGHYRKASSTMAPTPLLTPRSPMAQTSGHRRPICAGRTT